MGMVNQHTKPCKRSFHTAQRNQGQPNPRQEKTHEPLRRTYHKKNPEKAQMLATIYGNKIRGKYMEYRRLCNQVKNMTKKSKKKIERDIARDSKANPPKNWQYVNKKQASNKESQTWCMRTMMEMRRTLQITRKKLRFSQISSVVYSLRRTPEKSTKWLKETSRNGSQTSTSPRRR